jgi:hypothetical protein
LFSNSGFIVEVIFWRSRLIVPLLSELWLPSFGDNDVRLEVATVVFGGDDVHG